jgi:Glycine transporter
MDKLPIVLDLIGTFVFALSGALAGTKRGLDLFGVMVLSFAAGNSGGITRDLLIGAVPPGAVGDWRYLGVSLVAGLITFYSSTLTMRISNAVLVFDAAGLALFAVTGALKALSFGLNPDGDGAWHGHRDRWRHGARRAARRDPDRAARRSLRGRGAGGGGHRGDRPHAAAAGRPRDGAGADFMLPASRLGDQTRLAASGCERGRTTGPWYPEGRHEGC